MSGREFWSKKENMSSDPFSHESGLTRFIPFSELQEVELRYEKTIDEQHEQLTKLRKDYERLQSALEEIKAQNQKLLKRIEWYELKLADYAGNA